MSINSPSATLRRTVAHEAEDTKQLLDNIQAESWKAWPNEAGVSTCPFRTAPTP